MRTSRRAPPRSDATGYQRVLLLMALPGLESVLALRSMRLFAEEVTPAMTPVAAG
jgi:hypothetical protein